MRGLILVLCCLSAMGCPGVHVVRNPGQRDKGIRYYRPKPYLLITPDGAVDKDGTVTPSDEFVKISLEYLPDFSEEYSIHVRTGMGVANVELELEDGWNLTKIGQELDSKTNENISAAADLTTALSGAFSPTGGERGPGATVGKQNMKFTVRATNVPIGYYEAVIGRDQCGNKMLLGWKYVGFSPFGACCLATCQNPDPTVYGLVFESGVMVFKDLTSIHPGEPGRAAVSTGEFEVTFDGPGDNADALVELIQGVDEVKNARGSVTILPTSPPQISVNLGVPDDPDVNNSVKQAIISALESSHLDEDLGIDAAVISVNGQAPAMGLMPPAPRLEIFR